MATGKEIRPIYAADAPARTKKSNYPEPFASLMDSRVKQPLGDLFQLQNFGVNLTTIKGGGTSALRHSHSRQDEFIYVLSGEGLLWTDDGSEQLKPGMCVGFKSGTGNAHKITNNSPTDFVYLEIGDRAAGDVVSYPDDDLIASLKDGAWHFTHKDGSPY